MLAIQQYLLSGKSISDLTAELGIKATRHRKYANLVQFKYSQIDSPSNHPIVIECRGLILDESDDWRIIAYPFRRFFNLGDGNAAEIDWDTARVQSKEDGSLIIAYYYDNQWNFATSGTPDASGTVGYGNSLTFAELFTRVLSGVPLFIPDSLRDYTLMFELTTPFNTIVVQHQESRITLLGARNSQTGQEVNPQNLTGLKCFPHVQEVSLRSFAEIHDNFRTFSGLNNEGYVVVDANFNRVKVKHPEYVAAHHFKGSASPGNFLDVIRAGEKSEMLTAFPELVAEFQEIQDLYDYAVGEIERMWKATKGIETQKDFALTVKDESFSAALFALRSGKVSSAKDYLRNTSKQNARRLIGVQEEEENE